MAYQDLYNSYGGVNSMMGTDPYDTGEPDTQANTQPVTQTIKFDPVTGEQQMTIKGRPEDLSPANPNTPTLMMPGQTAPAAAPAMMPAAPAAAPATEQPQSNYNPESIAQALQQAGLSYVPPQPIATLAQAGTSDVNPPAVTMPPAATTVPQTTMPTGGLRMPAPAAVAPTTAPTPAAVAPTTAPTPAAVAPTTAPAPVAARPPAMDGAALTRQAESGGNYDVGYNRAGTTDAYGAYQILSSTYKDIQKADPYFQGRDQKTLSPADQDRAFQVVRDLNTKTFNNLGVPVTEPNLQLAHYLGATGASEYLKTGTISPEAAAANGGYEAADKIARDRIRMAGGNPDGIPKNTQLVAQDLTEYAQSKNLGPLMNLYQRNPTSAEGRAAYSTIAQLHTQDKDLEDAKRKIQELMAKGPQGRREIGKIMSDDSEQGSWGLYFLSGLLGMGDINKKQGTLLGLNNKWESVQLSDGRNGLVQLRGDGLPLRGEVAGAPMTTKELGEATSGMLGKGVHINKTESMIDPATGQVVSHQTLSNGKERFTVGGKQFTGDPAALVPEKQFSAAEDRRVNTALESLRRNIPEPTQQQIQQALVSARVPPRRIEQEMGLPPGSLGGGAGRTTVGGGQPSGVGAVAPGPQPGAVGQPSGVGAVAPGPQPGAGGTSAAVITPELQPEPPVLRSIAPGERKDRYEAYVKNENDAYKKRLEAYQNRVKLEQTEAQAFRDKAISTRSQLNTIRDAVGIVKSGEYLMGPLLGTTGSKALPSVQEFFASKFGDQTTTDNTRALRSLITKGGLEGIKDYMGPSISNFDVVAWLKANPITEQSSPQALEKYFTKLYNTLHDLSEQKRLNAVKHGMIEPSFNFGPKFESGSGATTNTGTTSTGIKWNRAQ